MFTATHTDTPQARRAADALAQALAAYGRARRKYEAATAQPAQDWTAATRANSARSDLRRAAQDLQAAQRRVRRAERQPRPDWT